MANGINKRAATSRRTESVGIRATDQTTHAVLSEFRLVRACSMECVRVWPCECVCVHSFVIEV